MEISFSTTKEARQEVKKVTKATFNGTFVCVSI